MGKHYYSPNTFLAFKAFARQCGAFIATSTAVIGSACMAFSAPLQTRVVEGADEGPLIRIIVAREDRGKVVGIDRQLAAFQLENGRLVIETHAPSAEIGPSDLDGALIGARAVMFPGGSGRGIANALHPEGVEIVRAFVREGGGFVGICAGAFLAGTGLDEYARLHHLTPHRPWAKGRAILRLELTPEGVDIMGPEFQSIATNYNNGPVLSEITPPPPDAQHGPLVVLSTFATLPPPRRGQSFDEPMTGSAAILAFRYGKGRVLTISPHPEGRRSLNTMVARCIGWTIHVERDSIHARSETEASE